LMHQCHIVVGHVLVYVKTTAPLHAVVDVSMSVHRVVRYVPVSVLDSVRVAPSHVERHAV